MALLALAYLATIAAVQGVRCIKRLYVRRFANDINRRMKHMLYADLVHRSKKELDREGSGAVLTKAISDVDACAEGMRKFTTEIFDTGVVLVCYIGLLLWYDVKIALLSLLFPPLAYFAAERMKTIVQRTNAAFRSSAERLNAATLDRAAGALTYRIFGCDEQRNADYDVHLADYERCAVRANIWVSALPPLYNALSMTGVLFILYLGGARVQSGAWDIASFTTFIACFAKLSVKSSKAAKLFNAGASVENSHRRENYPQTERSVSMAEEITAVPAPERSSIAETGSITAHTARGTVHCITIVGQIEGHMELPAQNKTTKYEHLIPQIAAVEQAEDIDGLLVLLNTVGGDVEAGLAIAELIAGMTKPTVSLVLGGGHSIGVPLAVAARRSFIAASAAMTIHPVRINGTIIAVPQAFEYLAKIQERISDFITGHSHIQPERLAGLMRETGQLTADVGTVISGREAQEIGLIDRVGTLSDALEELYGMIERRKAEK